MTRQLTEGCCLALRYKLVAGLGGRASGRAVASVCQRCRQHCRALPGTTPVVGLLTRKAKPFENVLS
mgnify:CR=1 FL=1